MNRSATRMHRVRCPYCDNQFELFTAAWCAHPSDRPSKICPHCRRCLCEHPAYDEPRFWKEAPRGFQRQGFRQLFLYYV
jgi:hypothetical protein